MSQARIVWCRVECRPLQKRRPSRVCPIIERILIYCLLADFPEEPSLVVNHIAIDTTRICRLQQCGSHCERGHNGVYPLT